MSIRNVPIDWKRIERVRRQLESIQGFDWISFTEDDRDGIHLHYVNVLEIIGDQFGTEEIAVFRDEACREADFVLTIRENVAFLLETIDMLARERG